MSMTITRPLPPPVELTTPTNPVDALLFKIQEAALTLPQEHVEEVLKTAREWHGLFCKKYKIHSQVEGERIDAAHALLFFRFNAIEYIMNTYAVGDEEKLKWLNIYNDISNVVTTILPSRINVEAFIEADKQKQLETRSKLKVLREAQEIKQLATTIFALMEKQLLQKVNQTNSDLKEEFETIKSLLQDLNTRKQTATHGLHAKIDRVTQCVFTLYQQLERQLNDVDKVANEIILRENQLNLLLDECRNAIDQV